MLCSGTGAGGGGAGAWWSWSLSCAIDEGYFDGVVEPGVPLVPEADGLPVVPVSPVLEVLGEVLEPVVDGVVDEELLLDGDEVSVLPVVAEGVVLLVVVDGVVVVVVVLDFSVVPWFLSQPARAAPARMKAAATGMSFFMTSPIGLWDLRNRACARTARATASRAL